MDPVVSAFLAQGILGLLIAATILGIVEWLPAIRERKEREKFKDEIIARQASAIERIADKIEAKT